MKKQIVIATFAGLCTAPAAAVEVDANVGLVSEYVFRGVPSSDGEAVAQGGLDLTEGGFYAGVWASGVDFGGGADGVEIDLYLGYGHTFATDVGDIDLGIGGTLYTYTDDADDDYIELNLNAAWEWLSLEYANGEYDNFTGPTLDYDFWAVTAEYAGFFGTFGDFGNDEADALMGDFIEIGYGDTLTAGGEDLFDWSISWIDSSDDLLGGPGSTNNRLVLSVTKSFGVLE